MKIWNSTKQIQFYMWKMAFSFTKIFQVVTNIANNVKIVPHIHWKFRKVDQKTFFANFLRISHRDMVLSEWLVNSFIPKPIQSLSDSRRPAGPTTTLIFRLWKRKHYRISFCNPDYSSEALAVCVWLRNGQNRHVFSNDLYDLLILI